MEMKRYNGIEEDPEGAFVYYDEVVAKWAQCESLPKPIPVSDSILAKLNKRFELRYATPTFLTFDHGGGHVLLPAGTMLVLEADYQAQAAALADVEALVETYKSAIEMVLRSREQLLDTFERELDALEAIAKRRDKDFTDMQALTGETEFNLRRMVIEYKRARDLQKEVADNQTWHVRDLKQQLADVTKERDEHQRIRLLNYELFAKEQNENSRLRDQLTSAQATIARLEGELSTWEDERSSLRSSCHSFDIQVQEQQATIQRLEGAAAKCGVHSLTAIEQIEWMAKELRRMRKVINDFCCLEETLTQRLATLTNVVEACQRFIETATGDGQGIPFQTFVASIYSLKELITQALAPAPGGQEGTK